MGADIWIVIRWWGTLFLVGAIAFPLTKKLFAGWFDRGYFFAKAVGMAVVTYLVFLVGTLRIAPFTTQTIVAAMGIVFVGGLALHFRDKRDKGDKRDKRVSLVIIGEELFFFAALFFWSWVKGHEASIHGLEKFMDYGFTQSILNSSSFPAPDMWYAGLPINYYYFGHTVMAVLTKLSGLDLAYTFNLMLATIFAFTLTMSFSIGKQLLGTRGIKGIKGIGGGLLTAFLVTLAGNMQTIYAFTKGYTGENPPAFWTLFWKFSELPQFADGLERYWYANATRFIPFTIHEFPSYSFVVSDVHGHVLSLPFVLLAVALVVHIFGQQRDERDPSTSLRAGKRGWGTYIFYGFLCGVLLMTNALDGPIYIGLFTIILVISNFQYSNNPIIQSWKSAITMVGVVLVTAILTSLPFLWHFKSFVSGIAVNCPPAFLAGRAIGPILFETVDKCQHSPLWMLWLLWGFFIYCGVGLIIKGIRGTRGIRGIRETKFTQQEPLLVVFFFFSLLLIIFPEFFYFKDIYPAHFRSNTMFKLGYQAFILFSIVSGYTIVKFLTREGQEGQEGKVGRRLFFLFLIPQLFLVSIYPLFSVRSYFNSLKIYEGLYGLTWLAKQYPDDYAGIVWLNREVNSVEGRGYRASTLPVIVEADGDSYTDHARVSAFTGLPAVVGWPVHEWLWRGTYDVVAPRREDVRLIYESDDLNITQELLARYGVTYVIVGTLERQKYANLREEKFTLVGTRVFGQRETRIYKVN